MIKEITDTSYVNTLSDYKVSFNAFSHLLVYEIDDKIVAFLDYSKMYEKMEINYIYVLECFRHNHIATKLLEYMINNNEFENITLEVNVNNENAIRLYKKFNFEIVATREKYYNGVDAYLMERR